MKKKLIVIAAGIVAGYGRHMYLSGYLKGRQDLMEEIEKMQRWRASERRPVRPITRVTRG